MWVVMMSCRGCRRARGKTTDLGEGHALSVTEGAVVGRGERRRINLYVISWRAVMMQF